MNKKFLHVQPSELKFPFRLNRLSTCWLQLTNITTDYNIAFKVKTTHPKKYCVRPNVGIISPGSTTVVKVVVRTTMQRSINESGSKGEAPWFRDLEDVLVSLQAQTANPLAIPKDKFLVQCIIAPVGLTSEKITSQLFKKGTIDLEEQKLRVVFVTKNSTSPIPEGSEEECWTRDSEVEKQDRKNNNVSTLFDSDRDTVLKLIDEKFRLVRENQELQYNVEIVRRQIKTVKSRNVVILVTLSVWLLGFVIGFVITPYLS